MQSCSLMQSFSFYQYLNPSIQYGIDHHLMWENIHVHRNSYFIYEVLWPKIESF